MADQNISVSLVSHGHGSMVWKLVEQLVECPEILEIIVTLNIPEKLPSNINSKVILVSNKHPKGFGANHNSAFDIASGDLYCVINPDIRLVDDPYNDLVNLFRTDPRVGLVAPLVLNSDNVIEDSMRKFLTPWNLLRRISGFDIGDYLLSSGKSNLYPDWIAGMFMLFRSSTYSEINGFDESYFMYCEDADICTRIWKEGYKIIVSSSSSVIHDAQRASRRNMRHLFWHIKSMVRYFIRHSFSLPNKFN